MTVEYCLKISPVEFLTGLIFSRDNVCDTVDHARTEE